jgi:hypothetical protein
MSTINNIFSSAEKPSEKLLEQYFSGKLSGKEAHLVEKYLSDNPFEAEAYEGLFSDANHAENIAAINEKIDALAAAPRTVANNSRHYFMMAASLVVIAGLSVFFYIQFEKSAENKDMAVEHTSASPVLEEQTEVSSEIETISKENNLDLVESEPIVIEKDDKVTVPLKMNSPNMIEESEVLSDDIITESSTKNTSMGNNRMKDENLNIASGNSANKQLENNNIDDNKKSERQKPVYFEEKAEQELFDYKLAKENSNELRKANSPSTTSTTGKQRSKSKSNTIELNGLEIVNYVYASSELSPRQEAEKKVAEKSVPAAYEDAESKSDKTKVLTDELTVTYTYAQLIDKATSLFYANKFKESLYYFDIIHTNFTENVNAQFYGGVCYLELKNYKESIKWLDEAIENDNSNFKEDAMWKKALCLLEMKDNRKAIKLLEELEKSNGFYAIKASEKLKTIK